MSGAPGLILTLANENAKPCLQLAFAQDMMIAIAIDAGDLHARIEAYRLSRAAQLTG